MANKVSEMCLLSSIIVLQQYDNQSRFYHVCSLIKALGLLHDDMLTLSVADSNEGAVWAAAPSSIGSFFSKSRFSV